MNQLEWQKSIIKEEYIKDKENKDNFIRPQPKIRKGSRLLSKQNQLAQK